MRRLAIVGALLVGGAAGVTATVAVRADPSVVDLPLAPAARPAAASLASPTDGLLLAWVPGGLPPELTGLAATVFPSLSMVRGDIVQLATTIDAAGHVVDELPAGTTVPLDAIAVDCVTWAPLMPAPEASAACDLDPGEALLGATGARLRGVGVGATLHVAGGPSLRIVGVVDDEAVGAAEIVVPMAGAEAAGIRVPRYILVSYRGDRAAAEARLRAAVGGVTMRVRGPGETPLLRYGDAVLSHATVKERFGEFPNRVLPDGRLEIAESWLAANLQTATLPGVGRVTCHRAVIDALGGALDELVERRLLPPIDRRATGCWNPRVIAGTAQPSRHAWGIAIDLVPAPTDPDAIEVLERWGFTWGGRWLQPDPVHFEYIRPAKP